MTSVGGWVGKSLASLASHTRRNAFWLPARPPSRRGGHLKPFPVDLANESSGEETSP